MSLADSGRNVVLKGASPSCQKGIGFTVFIPDKRTSAVVGTSGVVMVEDRILIVLSAGKISLILSRKMIT